MLNSLSKKSYHAPICDASFWKNCSIHLEKDFRVISITDDMEEAIGGSILVAKRKRYVFWNSHFQKGWFETRFEIDLDDEEPPTVPDPFGVQQGIQWEIYDN